MPYHILPGLRRPVLGLFSDCRLIRGLLDWVLFLIFPVGFQRPVLGLFSNCRAISGLLDWVLFLNSPAGFQRPVLELFPDCRVNFGFLDLARLLNFPAGFRRHVAKLPPLILYLLPTILGEALVQVIILPDAILLLLGRLLPLLELFTHRRSFFRRQVQPFT